MVIVHYKLDNSININMEYYSKSELEEKVYKYIKSQDPFIDYNNIELIFKQNNLIYKLDSNIDNEQLKYINEFYIIIKNYNNIFKYYYNNKAKKIKIQQFIIDNNIINFIEELCKLEIQNEGEYNISIIDNINNKIYYKSLVKINKNSYYNSYSCYDKELVTINIYNFYNIEINNFNNMLNFNDIIFILNIN